MLNWVKKKTPASPIILRVFLYLDPNANAQSSNKYNLYFFLILSNSSISQGIPK